MNKDSIDPSILKVLMRTAGRLKINLTSAKAGIAAAEFELKLRREMEATIKDEYNRVERFLHAHEVEIE